MLQLRLRATAVWTTADVWWWGALWWGWGIWEDRVEEEGQEERWGENDEQPTTSGYVGKANDPESGLFLRVRGLMLSLYSHTVRPYTCIYINTFII